MMRATDSKAGFALLEVLIGIAMLGMLATIVSGSLTFGRRVWERADAISQSGLQLAGFGYLRRQISQAAIIPPTDLSFGVQAAEFDGRPERLSFAAFLPSERDGVELPYMLSLEKPTAEGALVVSFAPLLETGESGQKRPPVRVLKGLRAIEFRYFGRSIDGDGARWYGRWEGQPWLPEIVEIALTIADGEETVERTLSIRPRLH